MLWQEIFWNVSFKAVAWVFSLQKDYVLQKSLISINCCYLPFGFELSLYDILNSVVILYI